MVDNEYNFKCINSDSDTTLDLERTAGSKLRERSLARGSISATSALGTSSFILHLPIEDIALPI